MVFFFNRGLVSPNSENTGLSYGLQACDLHVDKKWRSVLQYVFHCLQTYSDPLAMYWLKISSSMYQKEYIKV